jgi:hypothetical protein
MPKTNAVKKSTVIPIHAMQTYMGTEVHLYSIFISALDGGEWLTSRPGRFIPGKEPRTH